MAILSANQILDEAIADVYTELATDESGNSNAILILYGEIEENSVRCIKYETTEQQINDFFGQTNEQTIVLGLIKEDCPNNEPPVLDSTVELDSRIYILKQLILDTGIEYRYTVIELPL